MTPLFCSCAIRIKTVSLIAKTGANLLNSVNIKIAADRLSLKVTEKNLPSVLRLHTKSIWSGYTVTQADIDDARCNIYSHREIQKEKPKEHPSSVIY